MKDEVRTVRKEKFSYLDAAGSSLADVTREVQMAEGIQAPVRKGDRVGWLVYTLDGKEIGKTEILAAETVEEATYADRLAELLRRLLPGEKK